MSIHSTPQVSGHTELPCLSQGHCSVPLLTSRQWGSRKEGPPRHGAAEAHSVPGGYWLFLLPPPPPLLDAHHLLVLPRSHGFFFKPFFVPLN